MALETPLSEKIKERVHNEYLSPCSLMDRISDSGSDDHGSNPCGGTDFRGLCPLRTPAALGIVVFVWLFASRIPGLRRSRDRD